MVPKVSSTHLSLAGISGWVLRTVQRVVFEDSRQQQKWLQLYKQHYANAAVIDCLINAESRWSDVPNARGSGAVGYGQYMPGTWGRYQAESDRWDANPHDVFDVFAAISWDLAHGRRAQWTVGGC